jgi:hypothetical protein
VIAATDVADVDRSHLLQDATLIIGELDAARGAADEQQRDQQDGAPPTPGGGEMASADDPFRCPSGRLGQPLDGSHCISPSLCIASAISLTVWQ